MTAELSASHLWWEHNNIVLHILVFHLNPVVLALLPSDVNDDEPTTPCTLQLVNGILRDAFSLCGFSAGSALYADLCALHCGSHAQDYVTK